MRLEYLRKTTGKMNEANLENETFSAFVGHSTSARLKSGLTDTRPSDICSFTAYYDQPATARYGLGKIPIFRTQLSITGEAVNNQE